MGASSVIFSDSSQRGEWLDVALPEDSSATHLQELLVLCCSDLTMRRAGEGLQVFCQEGRNTAEVSILANQILADIALRERIVERSVVQLDDLMESVLCCVLKS